MSRAVMTRRDQIRLLGNGVVPQQAVLALRRLLAATAINEAGTRTAPTGGVR